MRLFVAVDVDRPTREAAIRLRERMARAVPASENALRWVHPDLLHLTVRFIGDSEQVDAIEALLTRPFAQPRFTLAWGRPGWLPPRGRPRVFQVPLAAGAPALGALAGEVSTRLGDIGVPAEERPFTAHLTLARVRDAAGPGLSRAVEAFVSDGDFASGGTVPVDSIVLYESRLLPRGPIYRARLRSPLR